MSAQLDLGANHPRWGTLTAIFTDADGSRRYRFTSKDGELTATLPAVAVEPDLDPTLYQAQKSAPPSVYA